ncbi:MAG: glycosyltransferase family 8 protein [Opitutaceae bacterium]|nr:glycosyltransferase family 8 protein [Opitutaceae bacterium]
MPLPVLHLAFQTDQNYVDGLVATLCGVVRNLPRATRVEVFVIDCGILPETRHRLSRMLALRHPRVTLTFLLIDGDVLDRLPFPAGLQHANRSVYARLFLPELLPSLDRILYLDCDLIVDADLSPLAVLPLDGAVVAAARDEEQKNATGIAPDFNSGLMVMDLAAMRASNLTRRAVEIAGAQNTRHGDQTLLNSLLIGHWKRLDRRWNRQVFLLPTFSIFRTEPRTVWHIYMGRKPWHFHRKGARGLVAEYYELLEQAGWMPTFPAELYMNAAPGRDRLKRVRAALRRVALCCL